MSYSGVFFQHPEPRRTTFGQLAIGTTFHFEGRIYTKIGKHEAKPQRGKVSRYRVWTNYTPVVQ